MEFGLLDFSRSPLSKCRFARLSHQVTTLEAQRNARSSSGERRQLARNRLPICVIEKIQKAGFPRRIHTGPTLRTLDLAAVAENG